MRVRAFLLVTGASALLLTGCAWWPAHRAHRVAPLPPPTVTFEIDSPESPSPNQIAISPDGQYLASWVQSGSGLALWMRPLAELEGKTLPGSTSPRNPSIGFPFWSPDSNYIAFLGSGSLQILDRRGGVPRVVARAPSALGGTWNSKDVIVYAPANNGPLYRTTASGETPEPVTALNESREEVSHGHPFFLPDGRHFIFLARSRRAENSGIWLASLDSKERRFLVPAVRRAQFAPPDTLLYQQGRTLMAQPLDMKRLALAGAPVPVVASVYGFDGNGGAAFAVSRNGVLVYRIAGQAPSGPGPITVAVNWRARLPAPLGAATSRNASSGRR